MLINTTVIKMLENYHNKIKIISDYYLAVNNK